MRNSQHNNKGSVLILVAMGMVLFFGVTAIAIDLGRVFIEQNRLQVATEAAAIAGGQQLGLFISAADQLDASQEYAVKSAAMRVARQNNVDLEWNDVVVTNDRVFVYKPQTVEYTFGRVLGLENKEVAGNAVAKVSGDGSVSVIKEDRYNVMPWAMEIATIQEPYDVLTRNVNITREANFIPGNEYILKLGGGPQAGGLYYPMGTQVLIPMGGNPGSEDQWAIGYKRAYGLAVWLAANKVPVKWLLGYRGGSFMFDFDPDIMRTLGAMKSAGDGEFGSSGIFIDPAYFQWVKYEIYTDATDIINQTTSMIVIDKAPRIAVYSTGEDAVTRTMLDAGISYDIIYDPEVLAGNLANYDWLHLHHEDFTGGGNDGGVEVPTIASIDDESGNITEGPVGGTLKIKGLGFTSYNSGNKDIKLWFHNTQLYLTNTGTYNNDYVHSDHMTVDADDNGKFEVSVTVPLLPDGTYRVYGQIFDEYTNYPEYTIVGSSIRPVITMSDNNNIPQEGPNGGTITVEGSGFGPNSNTVVVKFNGTIMSCLDTSRYADDGIAGGGFITTTPGGSFEVSFLVPSVFSDGTYEVLGQIELAQSNIEVYTIENYRTPRIVVSDNNGDPLKGPDGGIITVTGSSYRPGQSGINLRFDSSDMNVSDTLSYEGDSVVAWTDITSNADGYWQVTFDAPSIAPGDYLIDTLHKDPTTGDDITSNSINYTLQDSSGMSAEIYLHDTSGNPVQGSPGTTVIIKGQYFSPNENYISLWLFSTPHRLVFVDTPTYNDDSVFYDGDPEPFIQANGDGRFEVSFVMPDLTVGTHEVKALHTNNTEYTQANFYEIIPLPKELYISDDTEPNNRGLAGGMITVTGSGFPPNASPLKLYFDNVAMTPFNTLTYPDDAVVGQDIHATVGGSFEVTFYAPYLTEGSYEIRVAGDDPDEISSSYEYTLEMAENFWISNNSSLSPEKNAFIVGDTMYIMALNTRVKHTMLVNSYATFTCAYHGSHTVTIPLQNNNDWTYSGSLALSSFNDVHNGEWTLNFFIEDAMGTRYEPVTTIHITGVSNVSENAIISRNSNYSTDDVPLKTTERQYFKIQSPNVDYSDMKYQRFRFTCQQSFNDNGIESTEHNSGYTDYTNNWDGTWTGNYQCPTANQHTGDYVVVQHIEDNLSRTYEHTRNVVFFPYYSRYLLLSAYNYYQYETNNFYKYGMFYARTFSRSSYVNYLDMNRAEYYYKKYRSNQTKTSSYAPLVNEGNMIFHAEENLTSHQNKNDYYGMRIYTYIKDNDNNKYYTDRYFSLRNSVSANPINRFLDKTSTEGIANAFCWLVGYQSRQLAATMDKTSPLRESRVEFINNSIYVDSRQPDCSPTRYLLPECIEGAEDDANSYLSLAAEWFQPEPTEEPLDHRIHQLVAEYNAAPSNMENNWFKAENRDSARAALAATPTKDQLNWFSRITLPSPAHAAVYSGRYTVANSIRDWVANGGYLFAMCYATETIDITLAKDDKGNWIGYDNTFAFFNFNGDSVDDRDTGDATIIDQTDSGDKYDRPLAITQDHIATHDGFTGSTTAFENSKIKATTGPNGSPIYKCMTIDAGTVKYLGAEYGDGWFTFLGGHDPRLIEVYRLILNNILIGSLSSTIPTSTNSNYVVLDLDNVDNGEEGDTAQYVSSVRFGYPPSLMGDIVTAYPGDLPENPLVDTLPYNLPDETLAGVDYLVSHDMDRAEPGEIHTWRTPEAASSRYVLVPITSIFNADGSVTYSQPQNLVDPVPASVYDVLGRDKVRILRYALFYLSSMSPQSSDDPDLNEVGSLKAGEVRGKFIGWLR